MAAVFHPTVLTWIHFGDLHVTEDSDRTLEDFRGMLDEVNRHFGSGVDFCVLPGDNANNGTAAQYRLIRNALDRLALPVRIIPGDHDREPGNLDAFYSTLRVPALPAVVVSPGYRALFLDIVSAGTGGPDFRLSRADLRWVGEQLHRADAAGERSVIFMHAYPADLKHGGPELLELIRRHRVRVVDMGHTHYNELANDGTTIYATTRSTGQTEEGPVGFSVLSLEGDIVSWRFKPLGSAWPLVMVGAPADARLQTDATRRPEQAPLQISARAWSAAGIRSCRCRLDGGPWQVMQSTADPSRWRLDCEVGQDAQVLTVEGTDAQGATGTDSIELRRPGQPERTPAADGSDADSIGAWPDKHLFGTQLGPNRFGRQW